MAKKLLILFVLVMIAGFIIPGQPTIPVEGGSQHDWNPKTFWFEPWGTSGVHKGIDIFAKTGTPVVASTHLLVLYRTELNKGGKVIAALGPGFRIHYFAHLQEFTPEEGRMFRAGEIMGRVGVSGNAMGKPAHLHYAIISLLPLPWRFDLSTQGYKKMFYLDPGEYLQSA